MFDRGKLEEIIKGQGRKIQWLAEKVGITPNYLSLVLGGKRTPSIPVQKLMAIALDCPELDPDADKSKAQAS